MPHIAAFIDAIASAGLTPPKEILDDGKRHRFSSSGKPKDDTGWYILHGDDRPAGAFGCWRTGLSVTWKHDAPKREFSPAERAAWKKRIADVEDERAAELASANSYAAAESAKMWAAAREDAAHEYLARKRIPALGARVLKNMLLIPVKHSAREVVGVQRIWPDGTKRPVKGTPMAGAYTTLGAPTRDGTVVICEGYATGVSIHMATGFCVVVAFFAGNLAPVCAKITAALPSARVVVAADDDVFTEQPPNPGLNAAIATGLPVILPVWAGERERDTDFNDLHVREGLDAVRACFENPAPLPEKKTPENFQQDSSAATLTDEVSASAPPASGAMSNPGSAEAGARFPLVDPAVHEGPPFAADTGAAALNDMPPPPDYDAPPPRPERRADDGDLPLIFASMPMKTANLFRERQPEGGRILHWRGEFYSWDGTRYVDRDRVFIDQRLYYFMAGCITWKVDPKTGDHEEVEFNPKAATVNDVAHALRAVTYADLPEPQCWIEPRPGDPPASEIIAFGNGFLHWPTRTLMPSTDRLFVTNALDFDYDPGAGKPTEWLKFLDALWPDDPESIVALADMFGYLLTDDTSQQKMFMLIGPPRSGKGTILRVLESMVGYHNRVSPSLASVGTQFGLQPLIGKRLAMISDARLSGRTDQQPIVENLLRISGEDALSIDRKNIAAWTGKLPTRFVLASNELPAFSDASAALANRFMLFRFTQSFLGREDHGLTGRLLRELPAIVLWALDGLERLQERGYLIRPASSQELVDDLVDQTSPMRQFINETCVLGEGFSCDRDELFKAWKLWCTDQGRDHPGTKVGFGRQLSAAFPTVRRAQPRESGTRLNLYSGARMKASWERDDEIPC